MEGKRRYVRIPLKTIERMRKLVETREREFLEAGEADKPAAWERWGEALTGLCNLLLQDKLPKDR